MKAKVMLMLIMLSFCMVNGQVRPEAYLGMMPGVPGNVCSEENTDAKEKFISEIAKVDDLLKNELSRRHKNTDAKVDAGKPKMMDNAVKQSGVSPELVQKLKALDQKMKNATSQEEKDALKKEKKALADQMMQQSMNISMGEIENLKKMDKAGQKAWATAYATEKQAEVMADPKKYQDLNAKNMEKYNLQTRQKQLGDSLNAQQNKYMTMFRDLQENQDGKKLLAKIESIRKEIYDLYTEATKQEKSPDQQKLVALRTEMRATKVSYCNLLSPKYADVLAKYKLFIQSSIPAYYRFEKLTNEVNASLTGVDISPEPGEYGLGQISGYINRLKDAYKYNLYGPEDLTIG